MVQWIPGATPPGTAYYFSPRDDINVRHAPVWVPVETSMHGEVDKVQKDYVIKVPLRLWGAWENLPILFPSWVIDTSATPHTQTTPFVKPIIGQRLYGTTDHELIIMGRTGEQITYHNAQLTKLSNLFLGLNAPIFSADVEFTCLHQDPGKPVQSPNDYYTIAATTYNAATVAFAKTNFVQQSYTATWGGKTGFTAAFQAKLGWNVEWDLTLEPEIIDGLGTVDMIMQGLIGRARCIPMQSGAGTGPTLAEIETASKFQGSGGGIGHLLSELAADGTSNLAIVGTGVWIQLRNAAMTEYGTAWGMKPLRKGEVAWETTVGFATGVSTARAIVSTAV